MSIANDQILLCESVGCTGCSECIGAFYSKYGNSPKTPTKQKEIIKTSHEPTRFDTLSKNAINKPKRARHEHPLFDYIIEKLI